MWTYVNSILHYYVNTQPSTGLNFINSIPDKALRKRSHPKLYRSFELTDQAKAEPYQRAIRATEYTKYDTTSQISLLPGCVKRDDKEIQDNFNQRSRNTESYNRKVIRDYKSQVACLPGSGMKEEQRVNHFKPTNRKRYESHDIFLTTTGNEDAVNTKDKSYNCFNIS